MDEKPPRTHDSQDAINTLRGGIREEWHGDQNSQGRDIRRDRRRAWEPSAYRRHRRAIHHRHHNQDDFAHHGLYCVLLSNWPNADAETWSSASAGAVDASASRNEYCIAPTAN